MAVLKDNCYGKFRVRLTKVSRRGERHELRELAVSILLRGGFERSYTHGDNSSIVATDTMKNTVYALAKDHPIDSIESFGRHLAAHFVERNAHVKYAQVIIRQLPWQRIDVNGRPHDHAFVGGGGEIRKCLITHSRDQTGISGAIERMMLLKTTRSSFVGFLRDELTTLKETEDRIFATEVTATWRYAASELDFNAAHDAIRRAMLETFATHESLAVQQTLYAMGEAALAACPQVTEIELTMPNKHRLLVDLSPFGKENRNEIFVTTEEPYGLIRGTIARG